MQSSRKLAFLKLELWLAILFTLYIVGVRTMPWILEKFGLDTDPGSSMWLWNFSPVMAICLFGGARFAAKKMAWILPLGAYFLGDLLILLMKGPEFVPFRMMLGVYGCFALGSALGLLLRPVRNPGGLAAKGLGLALAAEVVFFLVTNFLVWRMATADGWAGYSGDLQGLIACYTMALPFFGRSLASTLGYGALLFSAWGWMESSASQREKSSRVVVNA